MGVEQVTLDWTEDEYRLMFSGISLILLLLILFMIKLLFECRDLRVSASDDEFELCVLMPKLEGLVGIALEDDSAKLLPLFILPDVVAVVVDVAGKGFEFKSKFTEDDLVEMLLPAQSAVVALLCMQDGKAETSR